MGESPDASRATELDLTTRPVIIPAMPERIGKNLTRFRLPFAGLTIAAVLGILAAEAAPLPLVFLIPALAVCAAAALTDRLRWMLWPAVAIAFAALQILAGPLSPGERLATRLSPAWRVAHVELRVTTDPQSAGSPGDWRFRASLTRIDLAGRTFHESVPAIVRWQGPRPAYGDVWSVPGSVRNLPEPRNPGQFNYPAYLRTFGVRSELRVDVPPSARRLRAQPSPIVAFSISARRWIERTLSHDIAGTPEAAVIRAMTVGDTSDIPTLVEDGFRQIGVFHLFSVSGLHVGLIALILWGSLSMTPLGSRRAVAILIPAIFFYALITGWKPASVRAALMVSLVAGGLLLDRRALPFNSVAAAAFLILLVNPLELFNPGFQLSFGVVFAILAIALPARGLFKNLGQRDPFIPSELLTRRQRWSASAGQNFAALGALSVAAWIGSLPLSIHYFHLISPAAIPANIAAVPVAFIMLALSLLTLAVGVLSPWLAAVLNNANFLIAKILLAAIHTIAGLPGSHFYVAAPDPPGTLATLTVLDCGSGGSAFFRADGQTWLVDAGSAFDGERVVGPFLRTRGVNRLSTAVLTHGDADHLRGFADLVPRVPIDRALDSPLPDRSPTRAAILAALRAEGIPIETVVAGDTFNFGSNSQVEILYPPAASDRALSDDKALVLRLTVGRFRALFLADSGWPTELWLVEYAPDQLACDLLVRGNHLSGFSGSTELLRAAGPTAVIVTGTDFPPNELPSTDFLTSAAHLEIPVFRQDRTGAVSVRVTNETFVLTPYLDPVASSSFPLGETRMEP